MSEPHKATALYELFAEPSKRYNTDPAILMACTFVANGKLGFYLVSEALGEKLTPIEQDEMTKFLRVLRTPTMGERQEVILLASRIASHSPTRPNPAGFRWNPSLKPGG